MMTDDYVTPEGFTLYKPLLLPDTRDFNDVLSYVCEYAELPEPAARHGRYGMGGPCALDRDWCSLGMRLHAGLDCIGKNRAVEHVPGLDHNQLGPFCQVDTSQVGGPRHRALAVVPTPATREAIVSSGGLVTDDDRLSWQVIAHKSSGRALVVLSHGYIIGSRYVAYIDPATIPAPVKVDWS